MHVTPRPSRRAESRERELWLWLWLWGCALGGSGRDGGRRWGGEVSRFRVFHRAVERCVLARGLVAWRTRAAGSLDRASSRTYVRASLAHIHTYRMALFAAPAPCSFLCSRSLTYPLHPPILFIVQPLSVSRLLVFSFPVSRFWFVAFGGVLVLYLISLARSLALRPHHTYRALGKNLTRACLACPDPPTRQALYLLYITHVRVALQYL